MKTKLLTSLLLLGVLISNAQKNREYTIVMRSNVGEATMWDNVTFRIYGFATSLSGQPALPGATLYAEEGDTLLIYARAISQNDEHTVHPHGFDVDQKNDGDPLTSHPVGHLQTRLYTIPVLHAGTYLYHCHVDDVVHVQMGMYGLVVVKPLGGINTAWTGGPAYDREFNWLTSEIDRSWHDTIPVMVGDVLEVPAYQPDYFLINGKSEHQLADDSIKISGVPDEHIYIRLANIGYYYNQVLFPPELEALIIDSDARPLPKSIRSDSLVIMPGERYGIMLNPHALYSGHVDIRYVNMNTNISANTQHVPVNIHDAVSVNENEKYQNMITIFPNPAMNELHVRSENKDIRMIELELLNSLGQQVIKSKMDAGVSTSVINTQDLPNGIYQVRIRCSNFLIYKKLIITK